MKKINKFVFPKALLNQLSECSNGYFLVTITQNNEFKVYQDLNDPLSHMGMINFLEVYSTSTQAMIRNKTTDSLDNTRTGEGENGSEEGSEL